jgi:hypothetical protein
MVGTRSPSPVADASMLSRMATTMPSIRAARRGPAPPGSSPAEAWRLAIHASTSLRVGSSVTSAPTVRASGGRTTTKTAMTVARRRNTATSDAIVRGRMPSSAFTRGRTV